jgi:hypothetical protein
MFDVLFLEKYVRQHSDFRGEPSEIGVLLDSMRLKDGVRNQREHSLKNIEFLTKFTQKFLRQCRCCRRKQPYIEEFGCLWIDRCVQPILLTSDSDYRLA